MPQPKPLPPWISHMLDQMRGFAPVQARPMFGGYGLYLDGLMFGIVVGEQLYFKVDDETQADYEARGLLPFRYEAKGRTLSLRYHQAPPEAQDEPDVMAHWARQAHAVAVNAQAQEIGRAHV